MLTIPVPDGYPHVDQITNLDGVEYQFSFRYNTRETRFYLSISSSDGATEYAKGIALVCGFPLLSSYCHADLPTGALLVISNTTDTTPPKLGELGPDKRCELVYFSKAELAELAG